MNRKIILTTLPFCLACGCSDLWAEPSNGQSSEHLQGWKIQTSLYTWHFDPEPEHNNNQKLLSVEALFNNDWLIGGAVFDNSYYQSSQLVYTGKSWGLGDSGTWYFKLVGGLLHGYKEPYEDNIPLNGLGIAPVIIPTLGFSYRWLVAEANLGGLAVVAVTVGVRF